MADPKYSLDTRLSPNFMAREFFVTSPRRGGTAGLWADFMALRPDNQARIWANLTRLARELERLRAAFGGRAVVITSAWRSWRIHAAIYRDLGRTPPKGSQHLLALAADVVIPGVSMARVQAWARENWRGGIGLSDDFTHLDLGPVRAPWNY